jgi:hypothetical protein
MYTVEYNLASKKEKNSIDYDNVDEFRGHYAK